MNDAARRMQEWRAKNPEKAKATYAKQRLTRLTLIREIKDQPCADCGKRYPHYVMDFDHVRGKKKFNLAWMAIRSIKNILEEVAKCDVVCANCHRERTYGAKSGSREGISRSVQSEGSGGKGAGSTSGADVAASC